MRLEQKQEQELEQRQGLAFRTIIQVIWLAVSAALAYGAIQYLGVETVLSFARRIGIPASVPDWGVTVGVILVIVFVMQTIFMLGYFMLSPEGRMRPQKPSIYSRRVDPHTDNYRR